MLNDALGTIVAFITIILLLSMLVTGLAQATQALLRVRGRNLLWGVTRLIQTSEEKEKADAKKEASKALNDPNVALIYHVEEPKSILGKAWRAARGPNVSWAEPEDLARTIAKRREKPKTRGNQSAAEQAPEKKAAGQEDLAASDAGSAAPADDAAPADFEKTKRDVATMERQLSKRFSLQMRAISLIWAVAVAIGFQVSAPRLLMELSQDSVRRERILAESKALLAREQQTLAVLGSEDYNRDVVGELTKKFPKYTKELEEVSGVGTTREFLLDEVRLVLKDKPDREQVANAYGDLLDAAGAKHAQQLSKEMGETLTKLEGFDIRFWRDNSFFFGSKVHWDAVFGVLLTAILLSFGAPFWFERLREAASLRDRLAPAPQSTRTTSTTVTRQDTPGTR